MEILYSWREDPTDWRGYSALGWPGHPDMDNWIKVIKDNIPIEGDIVICGTQYGGDVMALRSLLPEPDRHITVIDSFEGLAPPTEKDITEKTLPAGAFRCSIDDYLNNFKQVNIDPPQEIHQLWISPNTLQAVPFREIALLFVDVDQYAPAKTCYEYFVPMVKPNGLVLTHDYGHTETPGVKIAAEEFAPGKWTQVYGSLHRLNIK